MTTPSVAPLPLPYVLVHDLRRAETFIRPASLAEIIAMGSPENPGRLESWEDDQEDGTVITTRWVVPHWLFGADRQAVIDIAATEMLRIAEHLNVLTDPDPHPTDFLNATAAMHLAWAAANKAIVARVMTASIGRVQAPNQKKAPR